MVSYDGNNKGSYNLILDGVIVAEITLGEDQVIEITDIVNTFIQNAFSKSTGNTVTIKNDNDNLGVIVDVWTKEGELIDTYTLWFEDFAEIKKS